MEELKYVSIPGGLTYAKLGRSERVLLTCSLGRYYLTRVEVADVIRKIRKGIRQAVR